MNTDMPNELKDLPRPLQELWQASRTSSIRIHLSNPREPLSLTDSKIGGMGYLPEGVDYPKDDDGNPLVMLCQLNFAQIHEAVDTCQLQYPLPEKGILQVYIACDDDLYGLDFDYPYPKNTYQVKFWQEVTLPDNLQYIDDVKQQLDHYVQTEGDEYGLPFEYGDELKMSFDLQMVSCEIGGHDCPFIESLAEFEIGENDEEAYNSVNYDENSGHRMFGYPIFTQSDPRSYGSNKVTDFILLLQVDTDGKHNIMWGDAGVANFFIHPDDLAKQDFSRLLYNWDCC